MGEATAVDENVAPDGRGTSAEGAGGDVGLMSPPPARGASSGGGRGMMSPLDADLFSPPARRARGAASTPMGGGTFGSPRFGTPRTTPRTARSRGDVRRGVMSARAGRMDEEDDGFGAPGSERRASAGLDATPGTQLTATQDVDFLMSPPQSAGDHLMRGHMDREDVAMQTYIWGTKVNVYDVQTRFRRFLENFEWYVIQ